jgi:hypothetical protein
MAIRLSIQVVERGLAPGKDLLQGNGLLVRAANDLLPDRDRLAANDLPEGNDRAPRSGLPVDGAAATPLAI